MVSSRVLRRRLPPEERREEILRAAGRLIAARGEQVRVEDIVSAAGAAKGTFYLYFPSFDDLLEALRSRVFQAFDAAHPFQAPQSGAAWLERLEALALAFVDAVVNMKALHRVLFHSDFAARRPIPADIAPVNRLMAIIRAGAAAGGFRKVSAAPMARLLFAIIHETADAICEGNNAKAAKAALKDALRSLLAPRPEEREKT